MGPKINPKSMNNRSCVADAFLERFWERRVRQKCDRAITSRTFLGAVFHQKSKNDIQKSIQKSMPKKHRTFMPKGSKIMPKWMPKSMIFHVFSIKAKTLQTLCFPIYFDVLGMQNRCKIDEKSIQNRCWKKAC